MLGRCRARVRNEEKRKQMCPFLPPLQTVVGGDARPSRAHPPPSSSPGVQKRAAAAARATLAPTTSTEQRQRRVTQLHHRNRRQHLAKNGSGQQLRLHGSRRRRLFLLRLRGPHVEDAPVQEGDEASPGEEEEGQNQQVPG